MIKGMKIHEEILAVARRICEKPGWTFKLTDVVKALPHLNEGSVRTHVSSRCCINAPSHHESRWPYFKRIVRGVYQIQEAYRTRSGEETHTALSLQIAETSPAYEPVSRALRPAIHAVISESEGLYVAECLEIAAVTQGYSLDETLSNLREALDLYLSGEDHTLLGIVHEPRLIINFETSARLS